MPGQRICQYAAWAGIACFAGDVYEPLRLYQGSWKLQKQGKATVDVIVNQCNLTGKYYACEQAVNGSVSSLIVFVPGAAAGDFFVQSVLPDGRAAGRVELRIDGNLWTYSNRVMGDGKTTYYRTTNTFTGKDRIHFEQFESADGVHFSLKASGDEFRTR